MDIKSIIRDIPDFPKPGIIFKDITPLLNNSEALNFVITEMAEIAKKAGADKIAGIESRGFIFAPAIASRLNIGFFPLRKPGKLPHETISENYELEYGTDSIEIHKDAVNPGENIVLIDDLIATGGTALAGTKLIEKLGGSVTAAVFLIELEFLKGREKLAGHSVHSLIQY